MRDVLTQNQPATDLVKYQNTEMCDSLLNEVSERVEGKVSASREEQKGESQRRTGGHTQEVTEVHVPSAGSRCEIGF